MDAALIRRAQASFEASGHLVCPAHGARNRRLSVDIVDTGPADDGQTFVVVLPWALEGLIVLPDELFPREIVLGGRRQPVDRHVIPGLGIVRTVELVSDVTPLASQHHARKIARTLGVPFRSAVIAARRSRFEV